MTRTLTDALTQAGVEEALRGEQLKDKLIDEQIPFQLVGVEVESSQYGPQWKVAVEYLEDIGNAIPTLYFSMSPARDAVFQALGDATVADPIGPCYLTRRGKSGFQVLTSEPTPQQTELPI